MIDVLVPVCLLAQSVGPGLDRSERVSLPDAEVATQLITGFEISPDGQWAACTVASSASTAQLVVSSADGATTLPISSPGQQVLDHRFGPASNRIAFTARQGSQTGLYTSNGVTATPIVASGMQLEPGDIQFTASGTGLVFRALSGSRIHLFAAPADGSSAPVDLTPTVAQAIRSFTMTSDGQVLFVGSHETFDRYEVFLVPANGGKAPRRISGDLPSSGDVFRSSVALTPDGTRLLYLADAVVDERFDLYSIETAPGSLPVQLDALDPQDVLTFALDPTGTRAVFLAGDGLHSAPVDGSTPPVALETMREVRDYRVTADGNSVAYVTRGTPTDELLVVPIDGSTAPVPLGPTSAERGVERFALADDRALLMSDADGVPQLYTVPLDGSSPPALLSGGRVSAFEVTGTDVLFGAATGGGNELFVAPTDGSGPALRLSPAPLENSLVVDFAAASGRVFFLGNFANAATCDLFSVPSTGGVPVAVHASLPTTTLTESVRRFGLTPDGRFAVTSGATGVRAYSTHDPSRVQRLDLGSLAPGPVSPFLRGPALAFAPDSGRAYFSAVGQGLRLFAAAVDGSTPQVDLEGRRHTGSTVPTSVFPSPDDRSLTFARDGEDPFQGSNPALFLGATDGSRSSQLLGGSGGVQYTGDSRIVLHGFSVFGTRTQSSTRADGLRESRRLVPWDVSEDNGFAILPIDDETGLFLVGPFESTAATSIWRGPLDGSAAPVLVTDPGGPTISRLQLTPDRQQVVFVQSISPTSEEFWRMPVDGSAPPTLVTGAQLVEGSSYEPRPGGVPCLITPDGQHVVYEARRSGFVDGRLLCVPLVGGQAVALGPLSPFFNFSVQRMELTPDGTSVVYLATQERIQAELFVAAVDGSGSRKLSPLEGTTPSVLSSFRILADSRSVLFLADPDASGGVNRSLWQTPLAAGAPRRLSGPLLTVSSTVSSFEISPDQRWVYFTADPEVFGEVALYRVPLAPRFAASDPPR